MTPETPVLPPLAEDPSVRLVVADVIEFNLDDHGNLRLTASAFWCDGPVQSYGQPAVVTRRVPVARVLFHARSIRVLRDKFDEILNMGEAHQSSCNKKRPDQHAKEKQPQWLRTPAAPG